MGSVHNYPTHLAHAIQTQRRTHFFTHMLVLDDSRIFPLLSSALALLLCLLWVFGIFGRVRRNDKPTNHGGCPPVDATTAYDEDVWEVPENIGELTVSKLLVHPIKVSL